ncbi:MAG: energy-converting NiFe hydrogenase A subunit EhaA [Methanobrevibacter arboriphilus]|jgi:energy-converting hydrogenase A subunit A|nr:energy-converting hydrogenase A subunit A EhaA [Methanobrevibacter arboriphilus]MBF4469547.1 energy-converting NiFe hydrogenase A subunit EhaA [Methanobrevibacter arboriphilus]MCC7561631.1 energy-converting hydrogenase A subunit A EhaA [Methanobrevibacter arboriphilus]
MIIHVDEMYLLLNLLITVIVSIVIALGLGLPLLPKKPIRFSFDKSAIFPTPIFAIGFLAICFSVNFYWIYNGMLLAVFWGVVSGLFVKYAFDYVFPKPDDDENGDNLNNESSSEISKTKEAN